MRWIRDFDQDQTLSRQFRIALAITLAGNAILALIKIAAARVSHSSAIYSDAINSISDVLYSLLLIFGLWLSQRPPDLSHPQGHSRFEPIVSMIVTLSMAIAGIEAMRASISRFLEGGSSIPLGIPLAALGSSIAIKALMYVLVEKISKTTSSPGLSAAAHDNLSDVFTSLAALTGIIGTQIIHPVLDPLAGIFVALWIFKTVIRTARENLGYITGAGADEVLREKIVNAVKNIDGIENIHLLLTDYTGPKLVVEMHINVDGNKSLNESHAISDAAIMALENLQEVDRAYVHVEPIGHV